MEEGKTRGERQSCKWKQEGKEGEKRDRPIETHMPKAVSFLNLNQILPWEGEDSLICLFKIVNSFGELPGGQRSVTLAIHLQKANLALGSSHLAPVI